LNFCLEIPLVIAIQSLERVAGIQAIKPASLDLIPQLSRHVCVELALPAFESLPLIPSIWTTQFKREEIDLLGKSAPIFFVSMSAVWTNLPLSIAQLPATPSASPMQSIESDTEPQAANRPLAGDAIGKRVSGRMRKTALLSAAAAAHRLS
jgi:hypothetical protein